MEKESFVVTGLLNENIDRYSEKLVCKVKEDPGTNGAPVVYLSDILF